MTLSNDFFYLRGLIHILIIFLWDSQILYKRVPELTKTVDICSKIYYDFIIGLMEFQLCVLETR